MRTVPAEVADGVVRDLERLGLLDDASLARSLAERRLEQGWGAARVEADLERLAVGPEAVAVGRSLAEALEPAAARALLARRRPRDAARAWALLARRGFAPEVVEDAVVRCGAPAPEDDPSG